MRRKMNGDIRLVGGTKQFLDFLRATLQGEAEIHSYKTMKAALAGPSPCHAYILLPDYQHGMQSIPETDFDTLRHFSELRRAGCHLYIENYEAGDYAHSTVFGHLVDSGSRHVFTESLVATGDWKDALPDGTILQARGSVYLPGRAMLFHARQTKRTSVLLEATDCVGTHRVFREGTTSYPVLMQLDHFHTAALNLTAFDPLMQLPFFRWQAVFSLLFSDVLGLPRPRLEKAFAETWTPIRTVGAGKKTASRPVRANLEKAVEQAVVWHEQSGVLRDLTGRKGCFEMIRSQSLKVRANLRMDAQLLAGLLLCMHGRRTGDPERMRCGENLVRHMLDNGIQIENGYARGFFKWFLDFDDGPDYVWANDTARGGLVMLKMQALTGKAEYQERAVALGDAILRWLGPEGKHSMSFKLSATHSLEELQKPENYCENPIFYAEMASFLLQLFHVTGHAAYREAVLKFARPIVAAFPNVKATSFSSNLIYSRTLLMLCCLQNSVGEDCSDKINLILDTLETLQHPSGGIAEPAIHLAGGAEAGVGIGDGSDRIADLLYCNNFFLCALGVLIRSPRPNGSVNMEKAKALYQGLLRFFVHVQIDSFNPCLHGGWMRAYDLTHQEYYGLNKDKDWGPYCIMGGWVMGYVPLALLAELGEPSLFI